MFQTTNQYVQFHARTSYAGSKLTFFYQMSRPWINSHVTNSMSPPKKN